MNVLNKQKIEIQMLSLFNPILINFNLIQKLAFQLQISTLIQIL